MRTNTRQIGNGFKFAGDEGVYEVSDTVSTCESWSGSLSVSTRIQNDTLLIKENWVDNKCVYGRTDTPLGSQLLPAAQTTMILEDLWYWPDRRSLVAVPETDALTQAGALAEATLLDVKFNTTTSSAWLLFDCRGAYQLPMGNTGVVVVEGVTALKWDALPQPGRTWRAVMGWLPVAAEGRFVCTVDLEPHSGLRVVGASAEFFIGDIPGDNEAPPDFTTETDKTIRAGLASWSSEFRVIGASFTNELFVAPSRRYAEGSS